MKLIDSTKEQSQININRDELLIINSALNEICNGIEIVEFETRIGSNRDRVSVLLNEITVLLDKMDSMN